METISVDWDAIELDYRTGILTDAAICEKHNVSKNQLIEAARSRMWTQAILTPEDEATVLSIAEKPRFPIDSLFNADDIKRNVLLTAGQVVKIHRTDIAKLRNISNEITSRLIGYLRATSGDEGEITSVDDDGNETINKDNKAVPRLLVILGKDSPADLLEKLSRVMVRMTELERQAYGLDSMSIIPNESEENQTTKDIKALADKIRQITVEKAQKVEPKKDNSADSGQNNIEASAGSNPGT